MDRLVFFSPDITGGVKTYILNLSKYLNFISVPHIIVFYRFRNISSTKVELENEDNIIKLCMSKFGSKKFKYNSIINLLFPNDVLICNDLFELDALNYYKVQNKVIYILHGDIDHYLNIMLKYFKFVNKIFCVSTGLLIKYKNLFPSIEFSICFPLVENSHFIRLKNYKFISGIFIGRFEYQKGADDFIKIVNSCLEKSVPIKWKVFSGSIGSEKKLLELLPNYIDIQFDAKNSDILNELQKTDILVFPSRSEGFGLAILEGMKRGVIPIVRNLPIGIPDLIIDKKTGFISDSIEGTVKIIEKLAYQDFLLNSISKNAFEFSNFKFDFEKVGNIFMQNVISIKSVSREYVSDKIHFLEVLLPNSFFILLKYIHFKIKYR